ncbi:glycosyltransferase family 9 protein [Nonomuraea jiangxiensis]|uniref:ADP-heptose:LPS heptosyltransferase n=1 Tax=Nonomuraea jiangxiensis TaxID=633440 RepID=A0A1G9GFQ3_9ACTN|nr:glycosyltransferase family 9 protein [Nonomuraea jiangxiensis]SDK99385.1 ADP-heptose:LPS heptosyltransferase [Nonomuraea jiangxiensis]
MNARIPGTGPRGRRPRGAATGRTAEAPATGATAAPATRAASNPSARRGAGGRGRGRVLVARLDDAGDVLLAGPAVRAVRTLAREVVFLAGPNGRAAAELLPGVDRVIEWRAPWIDHTPPPVTEDQVAALVTALRGLDEAVVLTSFHQSALPLALLLRLAGVGRITAISNDYPGSLLDVRHVFDESVDVPEAERMLAVARAAGFELPKGDDGKLAVQRPLPDIGHFLGHQVGVGAPADKGAYVVVHPGTSAPARTWPADRHRQAVRELVEDGHRVVVTGTERDLTAYVAGDLATDLGGVTTFAELAAVIERAGVLVAGNTGPAHLAAAVGTPVVSLFAPVVPAARWAPYGVPVTMLGDQQASCRGSRARDCPVAGHPCLSQVTSEQVVKAVRELTQ